MKRILPSCFLVLMLILSQITMAQDKTVSGTVTAKEDGVPLPGVSIEVKGTKIATQTSADGKFTIKVPSGSTQLVFSYIGFLSKTVAIKGETLNVTLEADAKQLSEVVVVGYGTQKRGEITGAVSSVKGSDLADKPVASFDQALAGKVSGVQVTVSSGILGSPPRIRIRGTNSISNGTDPLYVVDGIPIITGNQSGVTPNNPLGDINPNDIQSVDVLKDGAATAIYGSRAANGVIIITTKRGVAGAPKVDYNSWFSSAEVAKRFDLLNADQFVTIANEKFTNAGSTIGGSIGAVASGINTNWQNVVFNSSAFQQNHNLAVSGATNQSNYYISLGYSDLNGVVVNNTQKRYQLLAKVEQKALSNMLTFGVNANISYSRNLGLNAGTNALSGNVGNAIRALPNVAPFNTDGSYNLSSDNARLGRGSNLSEIDDNYTNIKYVLDHNKFSNQNTTLTGGAYVNINPVKGLDIKSQLSTNTLFGEDYQYYDPFHGDGKGVNGYAFQQYIPSFRYVWTNTIGYNKTIKKHSFGVIGGVEFQKSRYRSFNASGTSISNVFFGGQNIISNSFPQSTFGLGGGVSEQAYESYFVRGNYAFNDKYLLSATFRSDKISSLAPGNQVANLPGASIGWRVSKEKFFENIKALKFIDDLKFRGGYSEVGNTDIGSYPFAGTFGAATYGSQSGIFFNQAGNSSLKFETSKKYDVGLDISILNSRVSLSADYFKNDVDNIILFVPTPPSLGVPGNGINQNIGKMNNKGLEFSVSSLNLKKKDFSWTTDFNLTLVKNKVLTLANNNGDIPFTYNVDRVGYSIGSLFGYDYQGVNPANGNPLYRKADGSLIQGNIPNQTYYTYDPANPNYFYNPLLPVSATNPDNRSTLTLADKIILGDTNPTYFGGLNNTINYKNFDFNLYFVFSGGNKIMNITRQESLLNQKFLNGGVELLDRWTPTNTNTDVPKLYYGRDAFTNLTSAASSRFVEDGSFIRCQTITLGYTIPKVLMSTIKMNRVRVYAQIQNAFVITKYTGLDPELNYSVTTNSQAGLDYNTNPKSRNYVLGINVGF